MARDTLHIESLLDIIREGCKPMLPKSADIEAKLQLLKDIRAVVFDVYGTLFLSAVGDISLASEEDRDPAFGQTFKLEHVSTSDDSTQGFSGRFHRLIREHQDRVRSDVVQHPEVDIRAVWKDFLQSLLDEERIDSLPSDESIERIALRYECLVNPVWPAPDVENMLWKMHRSGRPLGIVSNAQFFTPLLFERFFAQRMPEYGIREEACIWSYAKLEAKPSIRLYEKSQYWFQSNLGILPEQILYIGNDMLNDIMPASSVGFKTALYAGDKRSLRLRKSVESCKAIEPTIILTDWSQLDECL